MTFIAGAAWYSVDNAKKDGDGVKSAVKGPGGKPLPVTRSRKPEDGHRKIGPQFGRTAKMVFRYLAAVVFLSYVASGVSMFVHAFVYENPYKWSKEGLPWAGEWSVVRLTLFPVAAPPIWAPGRILLPSFPVRWQGGAGNPC